MLVRTQHQIFKKLLGLFLAVFLIGCSNSQDNASSSSLNNAVDGRAVKGVISYGRVLAYNIELQNDRYIIDNSSVVASAVTDENGFYRLQLNNNEANSLYYVELTATSQSRLLCDLPSGCPTDSAGNKVAYGQPYEAPPGFALSGFFQGGSVTNGFSANLTPLTHLAVNRAMTMAGGLSPDNLNDSYRYIESLFDLSDGTLDLVPPNITDINQASATSLDVLKMGVIGASFSSLINESLWDDLGSLSLAEVYSNAIAITDHLLTNSSGGYRTQLTDIRSFAQEAEATLSSEQIAIVSQPISANLTEGDNYTLSVIANSGLALSYTWYKDGEAIPGANASNLALNSVALGDGGIYTVGVSNSETTQLSLAAAISVSPAQSPAQIIQQPQNLTINQGGTANFYVVAEGSGFLVYQWLRNGSEITGATSATLSIPNASTADNANYSVRISNAIGTTISNSATLTVLPAAIELSITEQPASQSVTAGTTVTFSVSATGPNTLSYQWQKNGSLILGASNRSYTINNTQNTDSGNYSVTVSSGAQSIQSNFALLSVSPAVEGINITQHPQSVTLDEGGNLNLSVNATGGGFLAYQWRRDGINLPNQYNSNLTINNVETGEAGYYDVVISNTVGSVISNGANVTVNPVINPVSITQHPISTTVEEGLDATFFVSATGGGNLNYQWYKDGTALVGRTNPILTIPSAISSDQGVYHVSVSNQVGSSNSLSAVLTVQSSYVLMPVEVSWDIPTAREDGSALELNDISEYIIQYGNQPDSPTAQRIVQGASSLSLELNLTEGTYYFRIATRDTSGTLGGFSEPVRFTVE